MEVGSQRQCREIRDSIVDILAALVDQLFQSIVCLENRISTETDISIFIVDKIIIRIYIYIKRQRTRY